MKYMDVRFICQQMDVKTGDWHQISSALLTDPSKAADWIRLCPLRINVLSDKLLKIGVATDQRSFNDLMDKMIGRSKIPYAVAKRQDAEFDTTKKPRSGTRDVVELYQSQADKERHHG